MHINITFLCAQAGKRFISKEFWYKGQKCCDNIDDELNMYYQNCAQQLTSAQFNNIPSVFVKQHLLFQQIHQINKSSRVSEAQPKHHQKYHSLGKLYPPWKQNQYVVVKDNFGRSWQTEYHLMCIRYTSLR